MSRQLRGDRLGGKVDVCHVLGSVERGGAELRTLALTKEATMRGLRTAVITLSGGAGRLEAAFRDAGADVIPCKLGWGFPRKFARILRTLAPKVVHSHVHHASGYVLLIAAICGVPIRVAHFRSSHAADTRSSRRRLQRLIGKRMLDLAATRILAVSESAMSAAWGDNWRSDPRCVVVYNGFEWGAAPRSIALNPRKRFVIVHVGRYAPEKNYAKLLEVFHLAASRVDDIELWIVGGGSHLAETSIRAQVAELDLVGHVRLLGERNDVDQLLEAADVMVVPSIREGLPGAVIEACFHGLEVLASDLPVMRELSDLGLPITICGLGESSEVWAGRILSTLARSREERDQRREAAGEIIRNHFSLQRSVEQVLSVWGMLPARADDPEPGAYGSAEECH